MKHQGIFLYSFIPGLLLAGALGLGALKISAVASGDLIKGSFSAVYYLGADNKRYVFPNDKVYFSWYQDFTGVKTISDAELATYPLGGNITYRPGTRLVKIQSDPKVYAVSLGGTLRWINSESAANAIFGAGWSKQVDDIADAFFVNYKTGAPITSPGDYNPAAEAAADSSVNVDKGLNNPTPVNNNGNANTNVNANTNTNANTNANVPVTSACPTACGVGSVCSVSTSTCQDIHGPSNLSVKIFTVDSAELCWIGDVCTDGHCCTVGTAQFENNDNFKNIYKDNIYQYPDAHQLCDTLGVSSYTDKDIQAGIVSYSDDILRSTAGRVTTGNTETHISGKLTMSRVPGTCDWWFAPSDLSNVIGQSIDPSVDVVDVVTSKYLSTGPIPGPTVKNLPPGQGLHGAGYNYMTTEAVDPNAGVTFSSLFQNAVVAVEDSAYSLGMYDPGKAIIGNFCRDGKKDFDETGTDCGGSQCNACY